MQVELGDVVQIDGGLVIVTAIKGDKASVLPVSDFKGKTPHALKNGINPEITNNRLFERRGQDGLELFLSDHNEAGKQKRKGKIKLEPGDRLCYSGEICTVVSVTDDWAIIGSSDGKETGDERWLSEYFFQDCSCHQLVRLNAEERAANLKQFLATRKSPVDENETTSDMTPHIETEMKTRTKKTTTTRNRKTAPKPAAATVATETKATAQDAVPGAGRSGGRLGKLFGSSVVRVVARAGFAGATYEQVLAVLKRHKIDAKEATIKHNLRLGKNGKLEGAVLTKEQLAEFKA